MTDKAGLYITVAQMGFFLNRKNGKKKFSSADAEFMDYYRNCCIYNLVYDMMEDNPECANLYWDSDHGAVSLSFPVKGSVARILSTIAEEHETFSYDKDTSTGVVWDDDDEDTYGIFK